MRSIGAGAAGGVGEVMADYITKGHPSFDMYNLVMLALQIFFTSKAKRGGISAIVFILWV
jgi:hypothetical protein